MKVLIISAFYEPHQGGVEAFVRELANRLPSKKVKVDILACNTEGLPVEEKHSFGNVYRLDCWNALQAMYPIPKLSFTNKKIFKTLRANNYDVVHTQTRFYLTTLLGVFLARSWRARYVHTEHGAMFPKLLKPLPRFFAWLYDTTAGRFAIHQAAIVMAVSSGSADFVRKLGARKVEVVPVGIHPGFQLGATQTAESSKNYSTILYVGRLIPAKGVQDLLQAFSRLKAESVHLVIVGSGPYADTLKKTAQGIQNVEFLGSLPPEQVAQQMLRADIVVNPSYSEGLPTAVLEGAMLGRAIIATDVGGTRDIIIDGQSGFLIRPQDILSLTERIRTLVHNPELRQAFGQQARRLALRLTNWETIITKIYGSYASTN